MKIANVTTLLVRLFLLFWTVLFIGSPAAHAEESASYGIVIGSYQVKANAEKAVVDSQLKFDQLGVEASVRIVVGGENFRLVAMVVNQKDFDKAMFRIRSQIYPGAWRILLTGQNPVEDLSSKREMLVTQQESKERPSSQDDGKIQIGETNPQRKNSNRSPIDLDYRLKVFTSASDLESSDVQRLLVDSPSSDMNVDFRVMAGKDVGDFRFDIHYNVVNQIGDSLQSQANVIGELDSLELDDDFRLLSLARELDSGERHRTGHRLDRFSLQWQKNDWRISAGRQALSWGGGFIFHPIDPFNPFSPTAVDKDYKVGNDSFLVQRILPSGHDVQLFHVFRRDSTDTVSQSVASTAIKWHGFFGANDFELIGASHFDRKFLGLSLKIPLGPTILRTDLAAQEGLKDDDPWKVMGMMNMDFYLTVADKPGSIFLEFFHSDYGSQQTPSYESGMSDLLYTMIERGEIFTLMRDYLAVGTTYQWHPLLIQSASWIGNLQDGGALFQTTISYDAAQDQQLQIGYLANLATRGQEFGPNFFDPLSIYTFGGGQSAYIRWALYF